jgi:putative (di)nucleoside polyphosphate hydrolase
MIDAQGFRLNVGIILSNGNGQVLWARRAGRDAWQFPQGGMRRHETPEAAMFRELREEVGLEREHVEVMGCTRGWLCYRLPKQFLRHDRRPLCVGQKQVWFMLRLTGDERAVRLDLGARPEFDQWRWVGYWEPLRGVVSFKRAVYEQALTELAPLIDQEPAPLVRCGEWR